MKRRTKSEARQEAFRKFELNMKTLLSEDKIRIFNTAFNMGWDIARKKIEKKDNNHFKEKCICRWSKDNEYGFIPNTICPVHGKEILEQIKKTVPYEKRLNK